MQIGPYRLSSRFFLAPMAGITDRQFRRVVRRVGGAGREVGSAAQLGVVRGIVGGVVGREHLEGRRHRRYLCER